MAKHAATTARQLRAAKREARREARAESFGTDRLV